VAGEVEFLTPLCSTLQSDKVWEAKMADFSPPSGSQKTAHTSKSPYFSAPIQWLSPCFYGWR
jgi:hypothetical protein